MAITNTLQLSIVLPAYEEASNLEWLLPKLHDLVGKLTPRYEILVIDTVTPKDNTPSVCDHHKVRYIPREGGELYGDAIRTAVRQAAGEYIVLMDADGSHNPQYLIEMWSHRTLSDLVIASRYVRGGKTENPALLIFMSLAVNIVFRLALGLKCYDVSNSFRLYRGADFRALRLTCNHFDIVEEILVKLITSHPGYQIKEIPFNFEKRKLGKTKRNLFTFVLGYIVTLLRLIRMKRDALKQAAAKNRQTIKNRPFL
jgi:dolichol-phosphate mannosyltransferase